MYIFILIFYFIIKFKIELSGQSVVDNVLWTVQFEHIRILIFIKYKTDLSGHTIVDNILWTMQFERMYCNGAIRKNE